MLSDFLKNYRQALIPAIEGINEKEFGAMMDILLDAYKNKRRIFIAGNGGSAASANHFVCDFGKNAVPKGMDRPKIISVCDNIEVITALGNDISFEEIFSFQLTNLMEDNEVLIVISASGKSPNIINACECAKKKNAKIIALTGNNGGDAKNYAHDNITTGLSLYEQIEDLHLIVLHMVVRCMNQALSEGLTFSGK